MEKNKDINIISILKGVLIGYVITLVIFLIFAIIITYTNFPESSIPTIVVITTIISIIVGASMVARKVNTKGWLNGALTGIIYMVILYIISLFILPGFVFDVYIIYMLILGFISGAFGGILGINFKGKKSYKKIR